MGGHPESDGGTRRGHRGAIGRFEKLDAAERQLDLAMRTAVFDGAALTQVVAVYGDRGTPEDDLLDLTAEEFNAVASDIPPIIPRYDLYAERDVELNQQWTEMIAG